MKKNSGITLVALIITIVVMLILVAVSVNVVIKSNLLGIAEKATNKYKTATEEETQGENIVIDGNRYSSIEEYIKEKNTVGLLKKPITNDNTIELNVDMVAEELIIDCKLYKGNGYSIFGAKKVEILSGCTIQNMTFSNCEEIIIYSGAKVKDVSFTGGKNMTIYANTDMENCTLEDIMDNVKATGVNFKYCTINHIDIKKFENCSFEDCFVDGESYTN